MKYLLDTNAVIALLKGEPSIRTRIRKESPSAVGISSVVAHELYYGAFESQRREQNLARVDALQFEVIAFDMEDARIAGEIRADLATCGTPIGPYDILIAGQAAARDLVLVTHNLREFERVARLQVQDWVTYG